MWIYLEVPKDVHKY